MSAPQEAEDTNKSSQDKVLHGNAEINATARSSHVNIVLVGKPGSGKSATGNSILERVAFESRISPESVTQSCKKESKMTGSKSLTVIDAPSVYYTETTGEDLWGMLKEVMGHSITNATIFLLVLKVGDYTDEHKCVTWIQHNFGNVALEKSTIIVFTHVDHLKKVTIESYLESVKLQNLLKMCGGRYHTFDNEKHDHTQVLQLLTQIDGIVKDGKNDDIGLLHMHEEAQKKIDKQKQRESAKNIAIVVGTAVGTGGVVAGGTMLGATSLVALPAAVIGGGVMLAAGGLISLLSKYLQSKEEEKNK